MDDTYYTYGQTGSGNNRAGRVYKIDNGTVSEELYFGRLGETIKTIKTITDGETINSYTTKYTFDNLGRMRTLVYPDGEILTYDYDHGGLLKSAVGETSTGRKVYLENMTYDEFGQRTNVKYGNGAESTYEYEPVMRRLKNLKTTSAEGKTLQNIEYKYDAVGNITNRKNSGFNTNDDVSRSSEQSYGYDNMDRLETSEGKFDYETWNPFWDKRVNTYTNEFEYNVTGRILNKTQENKGLLTETGETVTIAETTYNWDYEYSSSHPNAVTKAGTRDFNYDLNGNMTQMTDTSKTLTRTLNWDDENRLKKTVDASGSNSIVTTYEYDASGMRALKKGKYGTVQYVSDNYTVRNKDLFSKHVFAGNTRLVSRVVMQEERSGKMVATEQGSYYYHADHLGSSSVVTDKNGKFYEHIEYFPYGEMWVQNKATSGQESTPYKFTSKELDDETGLYYYGYRYFDPRLCRWISADKILNEYLPKSNNKNYASLPGFGGVFNPVNLDLYHYAGNNPIKFTDPNGLWTIQVGVGGNGAVGAGGGLGVGIIFGYGDKQGFDLGLYGDLGIGGYSSVLLSATVDFAWSGNENVHDVSGKSLGVGGSGKLGIDLGGQVNYQYNTPYSNIYTFSLGIGAVAAPYILPVEGHVKVEHTSVGTIKDLVNYINHDSNKSSTPVSPVNSSSRPNMIKTESANQNSKKVQGQIFGDYCDAKGGHAGNMQDQWSDSFTPAKK